jgi:hypothetical protein
VLKAVWAPGTLLGALVRPYLRSLLTPGEHIPEDSDLILVELGINDVFSPSLSTKYERLIRTLLTLPNQPAIINIEYVHSWQG